MNRLLMVLVIASSLAGLAGAGDTAPPPVPVIGPLGPVPADFSMRARDLSPLDTGWSCTERVVDLDARIRQPGQGAWTGAVVAVAYDKAGAVLASGDLSDGSQARKTEMYDPPRLLVPTTLHDDTPWESGGIERHFVGLADVDLRRWKLRQCIVIESAHGDAQADDRRYVAPGVDERVTERPREGGGWQVATILDAWTRPKPVRRGTLAAPSI